MLSPIVFLVTLAVHTLRALFRTCGSRKQESVDSIANYGMMVDPWSHGAADPIHADVGDDICPIAAVFTGGECSAAESVVPISKIGTKAKN